MQIYEADHPKSTLDKEDLKKLLDRDEIAELLRSPSIIIINDHHRSTPSGKILDVLTELYAEGNQIDFIVIAGGTHEEPTDKQLSQLTHRVEDILDCELLIHDPHETHVDLVDMGTTSRGTRVKLHPVLLDYDNILCINSVEPHYFAGFTGGVKSIFPGLAAKTSVEQNHSWALSDQSQPTNIDTNPLQLDLWEAGSLLDKYLYGIQMVNFQDDIFSLHVGELREAFLEAAEVSRNIYSREVDTQFDVVVSMVYPPLDRSLYQAQKGIENTRQALKPGGEMLLVAKCEEGIGNRAFYDTMKEYSDPREVIDALSQETYTFGDHKAYKFATLAQTSKITLVGDLSITEASNVFADTLRLRDLEDYLSELNRQGKTIAMIIDSGSLTLSYNSK